MKYNVGDVLYVKGRGQGSFEVRAKVTQEGSTRKWVVDANGRYVDYRPFPHGKQVTLVEPAKVEQGTGDGWLVSFGDNKTDSIPEEYLTTNVDFAENASEDVLVQNKSGGGATSSKSGTVLAPCGSTLEKKDGVATKERTAEEWAEFSVNAVDKARRELRRVSKFAPGFDDVVDILTKNELPAKDLLKAAAPMLDLAMEHVKPQHRDGFKQTIKVVQEVLAYDGTA
jgi:hypothetical protein